MITSETPDGLLLLEDDNTVHIQYDRLDRLTEGRYSPYPFEKLFHSIIGSIEENVSATIHVELR